MKRLLSLILATLLLLGLCACGGGGEKAPEGLQVGFGMKDITPSFSVPLAGYGNTHNRMSTGVRDKIYITCIALSEGEDTVLLFSHDLIRTDSEWLKNLRDRCQSELGVRADRVLVSATHTHSSVDNRGQIGNYPQIWLDGAFAAAKQAMEDRAATTIYTGSVETEDMTFVRHYIRENGEYYGDGDPERLLGDTKAHATDANEEMVLVKFDRADQNKKDILLMNFQAHPCMTANAGKDTMISADFVGFTRQIIQDETDMNFIYFTGSAGNQNTYSYLPSDKDIQKVDKYAEKLAQYAMDELDSLTKLEGKGIKTVQNNFTFNTNKTMLDKVALCQEIQTLLKTNPTLAEQKMQENGLNKSHVSYVPLRVNRPDTDVMELDAVYVAGMAFLVAPFEMFSDTALGIRAESPFKTTVIATCADSDFAYFATREAYGYNSYESIIGYFAEGCAEAAEEQFINMLKSFQ